MYLGLFASTMCCVLGYPHLASQSVLKVSWQVFRASALFMGLVSSAACSICFQWFLAVVGRVSGIKLSKFEH